MVSAVEVRRRSDQGSIAELRQDVRRSKSIIDDTTTFHSPTTTDVDYAKARPFTVHAPRISQRRRLVWLAKLAHLRFLVIRHWFAKAISEAKAATFIILTTKSP